ncbi:LysR family transcriptional regulator [Mesorhizobium sp. L-8-3]|uniref:LysR family transcriptional regulator n=1 Tax=Mesorhizobium sp. L-8-3 TaxID=2744522 RepID=UPI001925B790|nr:LysR family transcriptional regulator [Mesorhizobium sp. L-8-3]BCH20483.1 LysR family transcriptional regulator [Mesorhizobium sp. L-8-3]
MSFEVPNLTLLKHFVTVAEDRAISKAAKRLRISQPALSKNIKRLEELLGTRLFERHSGGADLTQTGLAFFNRARVIGLEYEHAIQEIRNLLSEQDATIRIAAGPIWSSTIVPAAASRFHRRFPRHRLSVQTGPVDQLIDDLRLGRVDIFAGAVIAKSRLPGFTSRRVAKAQLGIMCAEHHPLAKADGPLDPMQLVAYPFVSFNQNRDVLKSLSDWLKERGAPPPRYLLETSSIYTCAELARSGDYLFYESTMVAGSPIGRGLVALQTEKPIFQFDLGFVFRQGLERLAPHNGLMKAMMEVFEDRGLRSSSAEPG